MHGRHSWRCRPHPGSYIPGSGGCISVTCSVLFYPVRRPYGSYETSAFLCTGRPTFDRHQHLIQTSGWSHLFLCNFKSWDPQLRKFSSCLAAGGTALAVKFSVRDISQNFASMASLQNVVLGCVRVVCSKYASRCGKLLDSCRSLNCHIITPCRLSLYRSRSVLF